MKIIEFLNEPEIKAIIIAIVTVLLFVMLGFSICVFLLGDFLWIFPK